MRKLRGGCEMAPDQAEPVNGGASVLGIYRQGFRHKKEALQFFRACAGDSIYEKAMNSDVGRARHYVAARVFLNQSDWEKFVWIEEHGSLDGFPG